MSHLKHLPPPNENNGDVNMSDFSGKLDNDFWFESIPENVIWVLNFIEEFMTYIHVSLTIYHTY